MYLTGEKAREMFTILFLSSSCQLLPRNFKQGQAEHVQTIKA